MIDRPRAIIDRKRLVVDLAAALAGRTAADARPAVLATLRGALDAGRKEIRRRFESSAEPVREGAATSPGEAALRGMSYLIDQLLRVIHDYTVEHVYPAPNPTRGDRLSVLAVGGYGRRELAPQSDIDLLFVTAQKAAARPEQVVEYMLYLLWDLGLKVGQATRSIDEAIARAKADMTIRTTMVDMRLVWGDEALWQELRKRFARDVEAGTEAEFADAKLSERDERHLRTGGSRYALEPNVKDGKGGLRDLHTLFWIMKYAYHVDHVGRLIDMNVLTREESDRFTKAQRFLWTLRCHLHYVAGRPEERLTFDLQGEISRRMGYTDHAGSRGVERLMKHYFLVAKDVGDLTRIFCAALEAEQRRKSASAFKKLAVGLRMGARLVDGFKVDGGRLTVAAPTQFALAPLDMVRLFRVAQRESLDVHPDALRTIRRSLKGITRELRESPEAAALFNEILTDKRDPETTLRRMNEAGVLGRLIPDFGRCVAQMQYNMYHHYTVDEHTIFAIGALSEIERGMRKAELPIASRVVGGVLSRRVLYVAVFMHDIAKGLPGDHSIVGAKLCERLCPKLGFTEEETDTVAWLVRWHLVMSDTAFKRDIDDPKTVDDFCAIVQSPERLRLLLVLTCADIRAVGPGVWNNWKATLLRRLYNAAEARLQGTHVSRGAQGGAATEDHRDSAVAQAKAAFREALKGWPSVETDAHEARGTSAYWLSFQPEEHAQHARMVREAMASGAPLLVESKVDGARGVTHVTVLASDRPGLLPKIAGALALGGATIAGARVFTFDNGLALDTFTIQDVTGPDRVGPFDRPDRLARLSVLLQRAVAGDVDITAELKRRPSQQPSRMKVFRVPPRVLVDNRGSATHTIVEVNGRDRPGFLYLVSNALAGCEVQIYTANIATFGEMAVDVFYIKDRFGLKILQDERLRQIQATVTAAIAEADGDDDDAGAKPGRARLGEEAGRRVGAALPVG